MSEKLIFKNTKKKRSSPAHKKFAFSFWRINKN
jgi:hypothetical protein